MTQENRSTIKLQSLEPKEGIPDTLTIESGISDKASLHTWGQCPKGRFLLFKSIESHLHGLYVEIKYTLVDAKLMKIVWATEVFSNEDHSSRYNKLG